MILENVLFLIKDGYFKNSVNSIRFLEVTNSFMKIKNSFIRVYSDNNFQIGFFHKSYVILKNAKMLRNAKQDYLKTSFFLILQYCFVQINKMSISNMNTLLNSSLVTIEKSEFSLNCGAILSFMVDNAKIYSRFLKLRVVGSIFYENKGLYQGSSLYFEGEKMNDNEISIRRSAFKNNVGLKGGVFLFNNLNIFKSEINKFFSNRASHKNDETGQGGVFCLITENNYKNYLFQNNAFVNNSADVGGIFYLTKDDPFINQIDFLKNKSYLSNNKAIFYGNSFATKAYKITKNPLDVTQTKGLLETMFLSELIPGKYYEECLIRIFVVDFYNNIIIKYDDDIFQNIKLNSSNFSPSELKSVWVNQDDFLFLKGYFKNYLGLTTFIYWINVTFSYSNNNKDSQINIEYRFRQCLNGEKLLDDFSCVECPRNFYSFHRGNVTSQTCFVCTTDLAFNCFGGQNITTKNLFWRTSSNSTKFLKCPNSNACIGDNRVFTDHLAYDERLLLSSCAIGYIGPLCASCEEGYGISNKFTCEKCGNALYVSKMLGFLLFQCFFLLFAIYSSLDMSMKLFSNNFDLHDVISTYLLKICSNHAQILLIIYSIEGTSIIFNYRIENNPFNSNLGDNLSLQCIFIFFFGSKIPYLYSKIIIDMVGPIFCFLSTSLFSLFLMKKNY